MADPTPSNQIRSEESYGPAHHTHADEQDSLLNGRETRSQWQWQTIKDAWQVYTQQLMEQYRKRTSANKGKSRQQPSTATNEHSSGRRRGLLREYPLLRTLLISVSSLILLLLILVGIESIHLFRITLSTPSDSTQSAIISRSIRVNNPDSIRLLNISDEGIKVQVDTSIAIDTATALDTWIEQDTYWKKKDRELINWTLRRVEGVRIDTGQISIRQCDQNRDLPERVVDLPESSLSTSRSEDKVSLCSDDPRSLLTFDVDPLFIPLPSRSSLSLQPLNLTLLFKPSSPAPYLMSVIQSYLAHNKATLDIHLQRLTIQALSRKDFRTHSPTSTWSIASLIHLTQSNILNRITSSIPSMPTNPDPNKDPLLNLTRYDFFEIDAKGQKSLGIQAYAKAFLGDQLARLLRGRIGWKIPFGIYLPVQQMSSDVQGQQDSRLVNGMQSDQYRSPDQTAMQDNKNSGEYLRPEYPEDIKKDDQLEHSLVHHNTTLEKVLLAAVASEPFSLSGESVLDLIVKGRVVPPAPARKNASLSLQSSPQEEALSAFLSRFLRGEPNTVYVRGGSPFTDPDPSLPGTGSVDLPSWLSSSLSVLELPISFPGSKVTDLITNVTLTNLSIKPHPFSDEKLLFSATIKGIMALPGELKAVDVKINELWPDILVFDGKPPSQDNGDDDGGIPDDGGDDDDDDDDDDAYAKEDNLHSRQQGSTPFSSDFEATSSSSGEEPIPPPPSPLPSNAFGRVRPHTWVPAITYINKTTGLKHLESNLTDVPFTILPGRGKQFRSFTWKLITSSTGVTTGIDGSSRVHIWNSGLGNLEIAKLPVQGVFKVGGNKDNDE
ncbi:unnamed protein product [Sympodiomycopsis kandeliae]